MLHTSIVFAWIWMPVPLYAWCSMNIYWYIFCILLPVQLFYKSRRRRRKYNASIVFAYIWCQYLCMFEYLLVHIMYLIICPTVLQEPHRSYSHQCYQTIYSINRGVSNSTQLLTRSRPPMSVHCRRSGILHACIKTEVASYFTPCALAPVDSILVVKISVIGRPGPEASESGPGPS